MKKCLTMLYLIALSLSHLFANEIIRTPATDFPIATIVEIPNDVKTYYFSGVVPSKTPEGNYGRTTKEQTINVLNTIKKSLNANNLTLGDIVKMQVFLVADPNLGKLDFAGFMEGYQQFFGTKEQPNVPARSAFEVKALILPEWLIEIEVIAVK